MSDKSGSYMRWSQFTENGTGKTCIQMVKNEGNTGNLKIRYE